MIFNLKIPTEYDTVRVNNAIRSSIKTMIDSGLNNYRYEFAAYTPDYNLVLNFTVGVGTIVIKFSRVYRIKGDITVAVTYSDVLKELLKPQPEVAVVSKNPFRPSNLDIQKIYNQLTSVANDLIDVPLDETREFWKGSRQIDKREVNGSYNFDDRSYNKYTVKHVVSRTNPTIHGYHCNCEAYKYTKGATVFEKKPCKHIRIAYANSWNHHSNSPYPARDVSGQRTW